MKIIIEYVLLENLLINLIVLKTTSLLSKEQGRLFFLSAFFGAGLTVVLPLFFMSKLGYFLVEIGVVLISVCISFKFSTIKKFLHLFCSYFVSLFVYGGACFFFEKFFGIKSLLIVLAVIVVVFFVIKFLLSRYKRKRSVESFCYDVEIDVNGTKTTCKGFLDSGNLLYDPLSEKPVSLVNFKVFSSIFKQIELSDVLMKTKKIKEIKFAHFINFKTLNFDSQILVFEIDKMAVGDKIFENVMLGLSLQNFNQAFGSDVILHNNIA